MNEFPITDHIDLVILGAIKQYTSLEIDIETVLIAGGRESAGENSLKRGRVELSDKDLHCL